MEIQLSPRLEAKIQEMVAAGRYQSPHALISEAVMLLDARDAEIRLRAALQAGFDELDRGEGEPYSPELVARIDQRAKAMVQRGEPVDLDDWS